MDLFLIFKFLHIAGAIAWIGGGVTLCAMGMFAASRKDDAAMLGALGSVGYMANRWFVPASLLTLACGIVMAFLGNLWADAWVVLGLAGFATTFCTGHFVLRIKAIEIGGLLAGGKSAEAAVVGRKLIEVAKFDYTMLFTVVLLMVLKPGWSDIVELTVLIAIVAAAAAVFLIGRLRRPAATA